MATGLQPTPPLRTVAIGDLKMKAPEGKLGMFLWRRRMWLEATFGTSLLEPWEKMTLVVIWSLLMTLIVTGAVKYLPQHLYFIQRRAVYYIVGREGDIQDLVHDGWASGEHPEL